VAQFFVKVKSPAEVLEYAGAFLELYRSEGWYLERTVHYLNRVGLDYVKAKVVDNAALRKELWERLQFALDGALDPWLASVDANVDVRQFTPVATAQPTTTA
jgi:nitrite reductase (NADH) large subunit